MADNTIDEKSLTSRCEHGSNSDHLPSSPTPQKDAFNPKTGNVFFHQPTKESRPSVATTPTISTTRPSRDLETFPKMVSEDSLPFLPAGNENAHAQQRQREKSQEKQQRRHRRRSRRDSGCGGGGGIDPQTSSKKASRVSLPDLNGKSFVRDEENGVFDDRNDDGLNRRDVNQEKRQSHGNLPHQRETTDGRGQIRAESHRSRSFHPTLDIPGSNNSSHHSQQRRSSSSSSSRPPLQQQLSSTSTSSSPCNSPCASIQMNPFDADLSTVQFCAGKETDVENKRACSGGGCGGGCGGCSSHKHRSNKVQSQGRRVSFDGKPDFGHHRGHHGNQSGCGQNSREGQGVVECGHHCASSGPHCASTGHPCASSGVNNVSSLTNSRRDRRLRDCVFAQVFKCVAVVAVTMLVATIVVTALWVVITRGGRYPGCKEKCSHHSWHV